MTGADDPKFERIVEDEKVLIVRKVGCNQDYIDMWSVGARLTRGPSQQPLPYPFSVISRIFRIVFSHKSAAVGATYRYGTKD